MDRAEAIKRFEKQLTAAQVVLDSGFGTRPNESNRLYVERKEMAKIALAALREQEERQWISVKERLPERKGRYLCVKRIGKSGSVYAQIMNGDSYGFSMEHIYTDDVTHWMPLPEPPKEN